LVGGLVLDGLTEGSDDKGYPLSVVWVAVGGLAAVAFYYLRRPSNTYQARTVNRKKHSLTEKISFPFSRPQN
jgi:hypothetical protein